MHQIPVDNPTLAAVGQVQDGAALHCRLQAFFQQVSGRAQLRKCPQTLLQEPVMYQFVPAYAPGTAALLAQPVEHMQRDFEFARQHNRRENLGKQFGRQTHQVIG